MPNDLIQWKWWQQDGRQPVIGSFRCGGAFGLGPRSRPLSFCAAQRIQPKHGRRSFRILSNAVEELGLDWSPPEEPSCCCLDEWFLPGRHQAPHQQASPFFPRSTMRSPNLGMHPTRPAYVSLLPLPSHRSTAWKKKDTTDCFPRMSQWPCISACPRPLAGRQKLSTADPWPV